MFDIEKEIVCKVIDDESMVTFFESGLNPNHFFDTALQEIFAWAMEYFRIHGKMESAPSYQVVVDRFPHFLNIAQEASGDVSASYLVDACKVKYTKTKVQEVLDTGSITLRSEPDEAIAVINGGLSDIQVQNALRSQRVLYGEDLPLLDRMADEIISQERVEGMPYPFYTMNEHTSGMWPGELTVLAGAPATGKTWMACATALASIKNGRDVYLATLEMPLSVIAQRIELIEAGFEFPFVPPSIYSRGGGEGALPNFKRLMYEARRRIAEAPGRMIIEHVPRTESDAVSLFARARSNKCKGIIIDQLQWMKRPSGFKDKQEAVEEIIFQTKEEADSVRKGRMPVLLLHQFNREGVARGDGGKIGRMGDLAFSSAIERNADTVWGIAATQEDKLSEMMKLGSLKERRFPKTGWYCNWNTTQRAFFDVYHDRDTGDVVELSEW